MTITIHGIARSRAIRNLWAAEELGLPYVQEQVGFGPEGSRSPAFLKINPNGHVPALTDGDLVLWESLAINLHLAKKAGGSLAPASLAEDSLVTMWTFWAMAEIEQHAAPIMYHTAMYPEPERDPAVKAKHMEAVAAPLDVLEAHLKAHGHLVGGRFTIADLNLACCVFYLRFTPELLAARPTVKAWYDAAMARPAAKRAFALRGE
jgi:glutathione S-transferase